MSCESILFLSCESILFLSCESILFSHFKPVEAYYFLLKTCSRYFMNLTNSSRVFALLVETVYFSSHRTVIGRFSVKSFRDVDHVLATHCA